MTSGAHRKTPNSCASGYKKSFALLTVGDLTLTPSVTAIGIRLLDTCRPNSLAVLNLESKCTLCLWINRPHLLASPWAADRFSTGG